MTALSIAHIGEQYLQCHGAASLVEYKDVFQHPTVLIVVLVIVKNSSAFPKPIGGPHILPWPPGNNIETDSTHPTPTAAPIEFNFQQIENLYENAVVIQTYFDLCKAQTANLLEYNDTIELLTQPPYCTNDTLIERPCDSANSAARLIQDLAFLEKSSELMDTTHAFALVEAMDNQNISFIILMSYINSTSQFVNSLLESYSDLLDISLAIGSGDGDIPESSQTNYKEINTPSRCYECTHLIDLYHNFSELHKVFSRLIVRNLECIRGDLMNSN